jgi:hypothetical protein
LHQGRRPVANHFAEEGRVYDPDADDKTKDDHCREMVLHAMADKPIRRLGFVFFTILKKNRLVSLSKEDRYIHLDQIAWTPNVCKMASSSS